MHQLEQMREISELIVTAGEPVPPGADSCPGTSDEAELEDLDVCAAETDCPGQAELEDLDVCAAETDCPG